MTKTNSIRSRCPKIGATRMWGAERVTVTCFYGWGAGGALMIGVAFDDGRIGIAKDSELKVEVL